MKRRLLFAAIALTALAGCTEDSIVTQVTETPVENELKPISFNSTSAAITRGDHVGADAANLLNKNFVVEGVKWNGGSSTQEKVFEHYNVNWAENTANTTTSNTSNWEYVNEAKHAYGPTGKQAIKYWDYTKSQYDFIAYSVGKATANYTDSYDDAKVQISRIDPSKMNGVKDGSGNITDGAYTIKGKAENLAKCYIADLQTAYRDASGSYPSDYQNIVKFKFRSLSSKVRIALYETVPGHSITDVKFYTDASTKATDDNAYLFSDAKVFNEEGTYIVYFPTTGGSNRAADDYNRAHLKFVPISGTGAKTMKDLGARDAATNVKKENEETPSTAKLYLGRNSTEATYYGPTAGDANHYTIVIPNEEGSAMNLKVDYTLITTDGIEEKIHVTGATATIPTKYSQWKPGYAYTYIFKISDNTNGYTGASSDPAGLYPITFDAIVTETEDGIQETITTVSDPSITTYAKETMVTAKNEYLTGANIYTIVGNGTALTVGTNANLYTVTLEDGAAQTISEASVANAIVHGTYDSTNKTYTVTDALGKKMVVKAVSGLATDLTAITSIPAADAPDGNPITINGAVFKPTLPTFTVMSTGTAVYNGKTYYTSADGSTSETRGSDGYSGYNQYWTKTATSAGTYVFEYIDGSSKKHYKLIKVVDKY